MSKILFILSFILPLLFAISILYYFNNRNTIKQKYSRQKYIKENFIPSFNNDELNSINIPLDFTDNFDWATTNNQYGRPCLTPVRNQGECGSCYAMVIIAMIESAFYRETLPIDAFIITLSSQQVIDCLSSNPTVDGYTPCAGCDGCVQEEAFKIFFGGYPVQMCKAIDYPYTSRNDTEITYNYPGCLQQQKCGSSSVNPISKAITIPVMDTLTVSLNENLLKKALYYLGPLYWGIFVPDSIRFAGYGLIGGVYRGKLSRDPNDGHAVIITGWGTDYILGVKRKYWIIQNSWGSSWANNGFMWVPRSDSGNRGNYGYEDISKELYCLKVQRNCNTNATIVVQITPIKFLINNITVLKFSVEAYIPNITYQIVYKIIPSSTNSYLENNNMIDVNNNVIFNSQEVVNNQNYYFCKQQKILKKNTTCDFKNWFYYEIDINTNQIITDTSWEINVKIFDKTNLSKPVAVKINTIDFVNIQIANINLTTNTIQYDIMKSLDYSNAQLILCWSSSFPIHYATANNIYTEDITGLFLEGVVVKNVPKNLSGSIPTIGITNPGYYQFFINKDITNKLVKPIPYSYPFKI